MDECSHEKSRVLQTRLVRGHIWRRRECKACPHRWNTLEVLAENVVFADPEDELAETEGADYE